MPNNHHFVSQCQIRNFFNNDKGKIYLFDKTTNRHFSAGSTKRVFSEDEANSKVQDGVIDHYSLEKDLKNNYEDFYYNNLEIVKKAIDNPKKAPANYRDALINLTKYGIASTTRNPEYKRETDDLLKDTFFNVLMPSAAPELKNSLQGLKEHLDKTKFSNSLQYSKFANKVFEAMGDISCIIYIIRCDKYFILPDVAAITQRQKINEYFNPDVEEIAMVGIPLTSKIFLHAESKKVRDYKDGINTITIDNAEEVDRINYALYTNAYKSIACENETYLKEFILKIEDIGEKYYPSDKAST